MDGVSLAVAIQTLGKGKRKAGPRRDNVGEWPLELVPLNDEARYASAAEKLLANLAAAKPDSGWPLDSALAAAEKEHKAAAEAAKTDKAAVLLKEVEDELAAGAPPRPGTLFLSSMRLLWESAEAAAGGGERRAPNGTGLATAPNDDPGGERQDAKAAEPEHDAVRAAKRLRGQRHRHGHEQHVQPVSRQHAARAVKQRRRRHHELGGGV